MRLSMVWYERQIQRVGADLLLLLAIISKYGFPIREMSFLVSLIVEQNCIVISVRVDN